ncbi:ketosteroid isomerase-like protein [Bradyrhizobium sp. AZCC 1678]|uniref:nuclear transport factor 2 family protein n=1 Tax=Bradyrhizobium sp. AZCC 1678 TaxID=3117030 RepID=UPI002FEE96E6
MPAIDTVKAHYDALVRRDLNAALDVIGDDAIWEFTGPPEIPFAGRWIGRGGAREFFERIRSTVEVKEFKVARMIADSDTVAVFGNEHFLVKRRNGRSTGCRCTRCEPAGSSGFGNTPTLPRSRRPMPESAERRAGKATACPPS